MQFLQVQQWLGWEGVGQKAPVWSYAVSCIAPHGKVFFYNNYYDHDDYYDDRDDIHCDLNPKTLKRKKNEDDPDQLFLF